MPVLWQPRSATFLGEDNILSIGQTVPSGIATRVAAATGLVNPPALANEGQKESYSEDICIIGDGIESLALACLLKSHNANLNPGSVRILSSVVPPHLEVSSLAPQRQPLQSAEIVHDHRREEFSETRNFKRSGYNDVSSSNELAYTIDGAAGLILSCPASSYGAVLDRIAPAIADGATVALVGATAFAALEFEHELSARRKDLNVDILEVDALFSRVHRTGSGIEVGGLRRRVNVAAISRNAARRGMWLASSLSTNLMPSSSILERALLDVESIVRPLFLLSALMGGRLDALSEISRLLNRSNLALLVELEQEMSRLAFASGCRLVDFARALREEIDAGSTYRAADGPTCDVTLAEALVSIGGNWFSQVGTGWSYNLALGMLTAYVSEHLVLLAELSQIFAIDAPVLNSVIAMSSALAGYDLKANGRSMAKLGLPEVKKDDLQEAISA